MTATHPLLAIASGAELWPFLVDSFIRGTAVLLLASVATLLVRRHADSVRHAIWVASFGVLLLLPVLAALLPHYRFPTLWPNVAEGVSDDPTPRPALPLAHPQRNPQEAVVDEPVRTVPATVDAPTADTQSEPVLPPPQRPGFWPKPDGGLVCGILLGGSLFLLLRLVLSPIGLRRLAGRGARWDGLEGRDRLRQADLDRELPPGVSCVVIDDRFMPMAGGILRPTVFLPRSLFDGPVSQLRAVLRHELQHLARRDPLWQLLIELAGVLYWYHPLYWWARHRCVAAREGACDDAVLRDRVSPIDYAQALLRVISIHIERPAGSVAFSAKDRVEHRLRAILDTHRDRRPLSWRGLIGIACASLVLALPVAAMDTNDELRQAATESGQNRLTASQPEASEAGQWIWGPEKDGWQGGVRVLPGKRTLRPGDPVFVQLGLKNCQNKERTITLLPIAGHRLEWRSQHQLSLHIGFNRFPETVRTCQFEPEMIREDFEDRIVLETQDLEPGTYQVHVPAAVMEQQPKESPFGRQSICLERGDLQFSLNLEGPNTPAASTATAQGFDPETRIYWGEPVCGLSAGLRFRKDQKEWPLESLVEADLFIRNHDRRKKVVHFTECPAPPAPGADKVWWEWCEQSSPTPFAFGPVVWDMAIHDQGGRKRRICHHCTILQGWFLSGIPIAPDQVIQLTGTSREIIAIDHTSPGQFEYSRGSQPIRGPQLSVVAQMRVPFARLGNPLNPNEINLNEIATPSVPIPPELIGPTGNYTLTVSLEVQPTERSDLKVMLPVTAPLTIVDQE